MEVKPTTITYTAYNYAEKSKNETAAENPQEVLKEEAKKVTNTDKAELNMLYEQLESAKKDDGGVMDLSKCLTIARRIMNGDRVTLKDRKFLQEKFPDLHKNAMLFRRPNPKPKKYDSITEEEEDDSVNQAAERLKADLDNAVTTGETASAGQDSGGEAPTE